MKTVILGTENGKPKWHPLFVDFVATLGIVPKVCRVRRPQTKGKVERSISFVKDNFIPGRKFTGFGNLNNQALKWCDNVNNRIHVTTGRKPVDMLSEENLSSPPAEAVLAKFLYETRKASRNCLKTGPSGLLR